MFNHTQDGALPYDSYILYSLTTPTAGVSILLSLFQALNS